MLRLWSARILALSAIACTFACEAEPREPASTRAGGLEVAEPADLGRPGWAQEFERSEAAQRCLDLVESQAFEDAEEVCSRALAERSDPEVEAALADTRSILADEPAPPPVAP